MKVSVLVDNNDGAGLKGEWGLSFYIEYADKTVLLDAGLSPLFAVNAEKMGLDLNNVDFAVLHMLMMTTQTDWTDSLNSTITQSSMSRRAAMRTTMTGMAYGSNTQVFRAA